jgi:hypothetical protein
MKKTVLNNIDEAYALLGKNTALIPIKEKSKSPALESWKELSPEDTKTETFQKTLRAATGVAVIQGDRSSGLWSIDVDSDEVMETFVKNNPSMKDTLITRGQRGANFWFRSTGECPCFKKYDWGEVRSEGVYTILYGIHPCGESYSVLNMAEPIILELENVELPSHGVVFPPKPKHLYKSETVTLTVTETIPYDYIIHDNSSPLSRYKALRESKERYEEWKKNALPHLIKNYETYIEREGDMNFSMRNQELIRQTTLLYSMVGEHMTERLIRAFYHINKPFFEADIHQHMKEFSAHLKALQEDYLNSLPKDELVLYNELNQHQQDTFRICRDLASFEDKEYPPPFFHLSFQELANRLDIHAPQAQRMMKDFRSIQFVKLIKKGQKYKAGQKSKASIWEWKLSLNAEIPV